MGAALAVEGLKLRKATAARVAAIAVVVAVPAMSAGFLAAARADIDGPLAAKIAPMLQGTGWAGLMGFVGQILSIGMLLAVGVVVLVVRPRVHRRDLRVAVRPPDAAP